VPFGIFAMTCSRIQLAGSSPPSVAGDERVDDLAHLAGRVGREVEVAPHGVLAGRVVRDDLVTTAAATAATTTTTATTVIRGISGAAGCCSEEEGGEDRDVLAGFMVSSPGPCWMGW